MLRIMRRNIPRKPIVAGNESVVNYANKRMTVVELHKTRMKFAEFVGFDWTRQAIICRAVKLFREMGVTEDRLRKDPTTSQTLENM
ncbi:hypothetical protein KIN20_018126 [Parelaphostrongylus tenuis]|uniref:Uncharacterized protein n=1 Tax=Parelaphostrongylus tenuis TaxID=148309 RepID=A0AAD5QRZ3_PARTN|nr:hypothetical protein KIN20_018126 [Parelaphostrongylus tenuis]